MHATNASLLLASPLQARPLAGSDTEALAGLVQSQWRRQVFRGFRLLLAGGLGLAAACLVQRQWTQVQSDQAFLNASITALRAPFTGQLQMEPMEPGTVLQSGQPVFRVENPRFGNLEAMAQLNWIQELVDRLRAETTEAELRDARQEQIFQHHESLFRGKLVSRLEYLEEESKVALCHAALTQKRERLRAAEARSQAMERHLELQRQSVATMPFAGVVWALLPQEGGEVSAQETVLRVFDPKRIWVDAFMHEKHAGKFQAGTPVLVRTLDGREKWAGRVESIRAGVGRMDPEGCVAVPPGELSRRRIAVRVKLEAAPPFSAAEFFGIGRSVVVTLADHE